MGVRVRNASTPRGLWVRQPGPVPVPLVVSPTFQLTAFSDVVRDEFGGGAYVPGTGAFTVPSSNWYQISFASAFTFDPGFAFLAGVSVDVGGGPGTGPGSVLGPLEINTYGATTFMSVRGSHTLYIPEGAVIHQGYQFIESFPAGGVGGDFQFPVTDANFFSIVRLG